MFKTLNIKNELIMIFYSKRYFLLLFLFSLFCMNFQCNDCDSTLYDRASFSLAINSNQNTFSVGDTLVLSASISSQIRLERSAIIHNNTDQLLNYYLDIFEGINNDVGVIQGRDNFELVGLTGAVSIPPSRTWEIGIENTCTETLCELELGLIPQRAGYFGLFLKAGSFGLNDECQFLSLIPTGIESIRSNNFDLYEEIGLNRIKVNHTIFDNPESENLLYFFKVVE